MLQNSGAYFDGAPEKRCRARVKVKRHDDDGRGGNRWRRRDGVQHPVQPGRAWDDGHRTSGEGRPGVGLDEPLAGDPADALHQRGHNKEGVGESQALPGLRGADRRSVGIRPHRLLPHRRRGRPASSGRERCHAKTRRSRNWRRFGRGRGRDRADAGGRGERGLRVRAAVGLRRPVLRHDRLRQACTRTWRAGQVQRPGH